MATIISDDDFDTFQTSIKEDTRRNSRTMRRWIHSRRIYWTSPDIKVEVIAKKTYDGTPITQIDHLVNYRTNFSLRKNNLFEEFINELENIAVSKTSRYDKQTNMIYCAYKVPACGYRGFKMNYRKTDNYMQSKFSTNKENIIVIGRKSYSTKYYYYANGSDYSKLKVPADYNPSDISPKTDSDEQVYVSSKIVHRKDSIDITYHHEIKIDYLSLHPACANFKLVHGLNVLENDPGYITKFDMYYRSSQTEGKWIKHGTFTGGSNWFEPVKINIEPVIIKELRIVPIEYHNNWNTSKIYSIGKIYDKPDVCSDVFVEYRVTIPSIPRIYVPDNFHYELKINRDTNYYRQRNNAKFEEVKEAIKFDLYDD